MAEAWATGEAGPPAIGGRWLRRRWVSPSGREVAAANVAAAGLYLTGGALTATAWLMPRVEAPGGVTAVGVSAIATASALLLTVRNGRGDLRLACAADLWGIALIAILCASSGGARSPFPVLYLFAIGHAAAFQPRRRLAVIAAVTLAAFLAPLAYEHVSGGFAATSCIGAVLAVLTGGVVHFPLNELRAQRRRLTVIIGATASLNRSLDPARTLREFSHAVVPELADVCVIDLLDRDGFIEEVVAVARDPAAATELERVCRASPLRLGGAHPVAQVLHTGTPLVSHDLAEPSIRGWFARSAEHGQLMGRIGYRAVAVFPMVARGRTRAAISFVYTGRDARFGRDRLAVLADLSDRAAMALDNAHLYAERTQVAQTLRRSLMPTVLPAIPGLELASFFRPQDEGGEVGGDFYDAFADQGSCWLVVGDVAGKGAEAAALTGFLRHTIVAFALEATSPASVLARVNELMLAQDFDGRFATAALVHLRAHEEGTEVTAASAGHPAALIARANGAVEELGERGTLLGVFGELAIEESSTVLKLGDVIALYTDGLLEAHAPERILTSAEMAAQLQRAVPKDARETVDSLLAMIDLSSDVRDDIVVLAGLITQPLPAGDGDGAAEPPRYERPGERSA
jgi:hypothetical protein